MTVSVSLRNVRKSFGTTEIIQNVSLDIEAGEFVVLVGPSGCGKSTLLRMIAGLEDVTGGEINIAGAIVNDVDPADRDIAMVFQSYALYPHMSVRENLAFGLNARGLGKAAIEAKIAGSSAVLGLQSLLHRYPRQLSGGQRQRVAMGRAMVRDPRVFLFDEPLSNLDAKLRVQMRVEIKALHRRLKSTAIYVTHDQIEAMTMADRIVLMRAGVIEQIGKPVELYDRPATIFVAQFLGSPTMNLFHGEVTPSAGGGIELLTRDGHRFALPLDARVTAGQRIFIGLRPEHLCITENGIPCEIELTELLGREILLYGKVGESLVCIAPGNRPRIEVGQRVGIAYDVENACVFDHQSERSLRRGH